MDDIRRKTKYVEHSALAAGIGRILAEGKTVTLPLRGRSMRPFLEDGRDMAVLAAVKCLKQGDVVFAETAPGSFVLHRIVRIDGDRLTLRGDGNIGTEQCLTGNVKAVATAFYRKGRPTADSTDGMKWSIYSWLWTHLLPIRRYLLFIYRHTRWQAPASRQ